MVNEVTTIQIPVSLKKELDSIKEYKRETYADVIMRLVLRVKEDEEANLELSEEVLKGIERSREDVRKGRVYTTEQIEKELGI